MIKTLVASERANVTLNPSQNDILPRETCFNGGTNVIAAALQPWARKTHCFTLLCALEVCGLQIPQDITKYPYLSDRLQAALRRLGCVPDGGKTEQGAGIWVFHDELVVPFDEVGERVTCRGFSDDSRDAPPLPAQVEVCRAWLVEHARPTGAIARKFTSDGFRRLVTAWTQATKKFTDREQLNVHTGERYFSDRVYVTNGAFLAAALAEGYRAQKVHGSHDAWFNIAYHRTGEIFLGARIRARTPYVCRPRQPRTPKARLETFLNRVAKRTFYGIQGLFTLEQATKVARCPNVRKLLRQLGCGHRLMWIKTRGRWCMWYRFKDMPEHWRLTQPKPQKPRPKVPPKVPSQLSELVKYLADKSSITLREAALAAGLSVPKGRAPKALSLTLSAQGFVNRDGRWVRLSG